MAFTILRGGRVLDSAAGTAEFADILIEDDTIREIGPPGLPAPDAARPIAADRRLLQQTRRDRAYRTAEPVSS